MNSTSNTRTDHERGSYRERTLRLDMELPVSDFCRAYGWSTRKMNSWLQNHGIQYREDNAWYLDEELEGCGLAIPVTQIYYGRTGLMHPNGILLWTPKGRAFLYDFLKDNGILPLEERKKEAVNA